MGCSPSTKGNIWSYNAPFYALGLLAWYDNTEKQSLQRTNNNLFSSYNLSSYRVINDNFNSAKICYGSNTNLKVICIYGKQISTVSTNKPNQVKVCNFDMSTYIVKMTRFHWRSSPSRPKARGWYAFRVSKMKCTHN
jgi:hypothetical protein